MPRSQKTPEEAAFVQAAKFLGDSFGVASLKDVIIVGVQHIVGTNFRLFLHLVEEFALKPENVFLLGKCYSTNPDVLNKFLERGFCVAEESQEYKLDEDFEEYFTDIVQSVWARWREELGARNAGNIVLLDDGGHLLRAVSETWTEYPFEATVFGVEQTSAGLRRNHSMKLRFPIINVARSEVKLRKESQFIADSVAGIVRQRQQQPGRDRHRVLIIGAGAIGKAVCRKLDAYGMDVEVYDDNSEVSDFDRIELRQRLRDVDIVVGATGTRSLTLSEIEGISTGCQLISASSEDREFPAKELRSKGRRLGADYLADIDYRGVLLVNNGFPVNFCQDAHLADPESMFLTRILMLGAIFQGLSPADKPAIWIRLDYKVEVYADIVYEVASQACVSPTLVERYSWLKEWKSSEEDFLSRIKRLYPYNELLTEMAAASIDGSRLRRVEGMNNGIVFHFENPDVALMNDGSMRGVPYEYLNFGHYEENELLAVLRVLESFKEGSVLDIGAHIGWFGLNVCGKYPKVKVHALEPMPRTFDVLEENIRLNGFKNIEAHRVGVGREHGTSAFYYSRPYSVLASRVKLFPMEESADIINVDLVPLDAFCRDRAIESVEFIKYDVEGQEFDVIQGSKKTLKESRPALLLELYEPWCRNFDYTSRDVFDFLEQLGYEAFAVVDGGWIRSITEVPKVQRAEFSTDYNIMFLHSVKHQEVIRELSVE